MSIVNVPFRVKPDIEAKLRTGEYIRNGGVIRDRKTGQIIEHLKEAGKSSNSATEKSNSVRGGYSKTNNYGTNTSNNQGWGYAIFAGVGILAATFFGIRHSRKHCQEVEDFNNAYEVYKTKVKNGSIDHATIKNLMNAIRKVKSSPKFDKIKKFLPDLTYDMPDLIDYTIRFAKANNMNFKEPNDKFEIHLLQALLIAQQAVFNKENVEAVEQTSCA